MRVKSGQDWATGFLFILVGALALWIGWDYPMGSAQRPGTGVLPRILSWCLIVTGGLIWVQAALTNGPPMGKWAWKPLILTTLAVCAFGLLIDDLGLVVTMVISMTLLAMGTSETRWGEFAIFAAIMIAIGFGMFIWLLGMPIQTWPVRVPWFLAYVIR